MRWRFLGLLARTELRLIWVFSGNGRVRQIVRLKYDIKCEAPGQPTKRLKTRFLERNRVFKLQIGIFHSFNEFTGRSCRRRRFGYCRFWH